MEVSGLEVACRKLNLVWFVPGEIATQWGNASAIVGWSWRWRVGTKPNLHLEHHRVSLQLTMPFESSGRSPRIRHTVGTLLSIYIFVFPVSFADDG